MEELAFEPLPLNSLLDICSYCTTLFAKESTLLRLEGEFRVVGDLHGHLPDLIRIIKKCGGPKKHNYIFLGDYVDRGNFSIETIMLLLALKAEYPNSVYLIRGNHEFESISRTKGLHDEILKVYGNDVLFQKLIECFSFLPIGALVNNNILCVHGGIGPELKTLENFDNIARPLNQLYGGLADDILWSDPLDKGTGFKVSKRGNGVFFGEDVTNKFLKQNHLHLIIRGHTSVKEGIRFQHHNKVITVFSASNYCDQQNKAAVLILRKNKEEYITFEPLADIKRKIFPKFGGLSLRTKESRSLPLPPNRHTRNECKIRSAKILLK
ncbi:Ser/Thr protein phosphatase [Histomonas meleagridis]|uniref:Ser/Thr protein phosphatase n=1 Tax=Histomonas meleagridis TaxID=135588 RepID=UPI0035594925|nr:Ser/Thr protein phosphatase [Histomonas meleagridis]KAH0796824.1 Ser/Thr protein phosphatase [Histomonas meleagridis]